MMQEAGGTIVLTGNAVELLRCMPDQSVHCVVTSPPYDDLRAYNGYVFDFEATATELVRVLVPGGVICWVVGDSVVDGSETLTSCKQKIFFREQLGLRVHDTMIYEKVNFGHPEKTRYHQVFEYVFVLSKGAPRCFNPIEDRANIYAGTTGPWGVNNNRQRDGTMTERRSVTIAPFGKRFNVWRGKTSGQERRTTGSLHPAAMPEWLAGDLILSWSNAGDVVLDPLAGSGTTGLMAQRHGRRAVLMDCSAEYSGVQVARLTAAL